MNEESSPPMDGGAAASETIDPTIQRKHAAMIERLSNLHQSRVSRKSDDTHSSFESTQSFLSLFSESKQSILSDLTRIEQTPGPDLKSELDKVSSSISQLEKLVAENSYFLPPYEVRSSLKTILDLKQSLDVVNSKAIPRKKFSFKNKPAKKSDGDSLGVSETRVADSIKVEKPPKDPGFKLRDSPGFKGKENEVLVKEFKGDSDLEGNGEFVISDLSNCEVRLKCCLRALFINRLKNCRIYAGPIFGSILIDQVEGCVFVLASHQIRIHHAKGSDFYLRSRGRPIIEESSGVRFAPYCLSYDGIESDLKDSNLFEDNGNWANVDDFQWLRAVQSPNWSVLPEKEHIDPVSI